jgi:TPR repeat protein
MDNKMKKLGFLLPALLSLNVIELGLHAEPSFYDQQIAEINRVHDEQQAILDRAIQAERAEQKRREENQRQEELAPSRAINSCNYGDINMCFLVGNGYKNGRSTINNIYAWFGYDDFKAVQFFTKACNGGNAKGCGALGTMYNEGKGTPQNKDKAAQLFIKACNANEASACNNLGTMYQNGYGMWGNKSKAKELYSKACQLHSQAGCTNYANLNK